ncbi:MAG TPA: peptidylprolyl isomerase [Candidatus Binatia bacterium]|jgi:hypothetical protein
MVRLRAWLRTPALHFLVLGALLYGLTARQGGPPPRRPIVITPERIAEIREDYERTAHVAPTADELNGLIAREADEEMLFHEAQLLHLDRGDRAVEWRVIEKVRFLYGDAAGDNAAALKRGLALGLDHDDVIVRNAMVTKIRLLARAASRADEPAGPELERELGDCMARHRADYTQAEKLSVTQVFLSTDTRGPAVEADAQALLAHLRESGAGPEAARRLGDPFIAGSALRSTTREQLAKVFGDGFATTVAGIAPGQWSGPVRSPFGLHLVWVGEHDAATLPSLAAVRSRVLRTYRAERRARYLAKMMDQLRMAYEVRIAHDQTL